jgi:cytochrome c oxidase cbb3-type subunit 3
VDAYWLHGGGISDVFTTIKYGVPTKGMIAWKDNLRAGEMQEVSSYILSMAGTMPANPKDPEGDLFTAVTEVAEEVPMEE